MNCENDFILQKSENAKSTDYGHVLLLDILDIRIVVGYYAEKGAYTG